MPKLIKNYPRIASWESTALLHEPLTVNAYAVNEELLDAPESINESPYDAWFVKVKDIAEREELLSAQEYQEFVENE